MLNMDGWVTPNHFKIADFEKFGKLTPDEEFDLVAPVLVYFQADLGYKKEARATLKKLKGLKHPLVDDKAMSELLESPPEGLVNRYNALVLKIVSDAAPQATPYIDTYGAFGFTFGSDHRAMMGDVSGLFGFYLRSLDVRSRFS